MAQIQLSLEVAEVNQILEALGELPYSQVYQLVSKMQQQAEASLSQAERISNSTTPPPSPPQPKAK